jgi:hypothetical protein
MQPSVHQCERGQMNMSTMNETRRIIPGVGFEKSFILES